MGKSRFSSHSVAATTAHSPTAAIDAPPNSTASDSGRKRAPPQLGHGASSRRSSSQANSSPSALALTRSSQRASPMNRRPSPCHSRSAAWSGQSPTGCSGSTWCRRQKDCRRSRKSPCPKSCHRGPSAPSSVACPPAKICSLLKPLCTPRPRHVAGPDCAIEGKQRGF